MCAAPKFNFLGNVLPKKNSKRHGTSLNFRFRFKGIILVFKIETSSFLCILFPYFRIYEIHINLL